MNRTFATVTLVLAALAAFLVRGTSHAAPASWGFDMANLDTSVAPCDDFYQYAVGGWLKTHPIPGAYPSWGSFDVVDTRNQDILHRILDQDAAAHAPRGSVRQKVGDFYASGMDEAAIEKAGLAPIAPLLSQVRGLGDLPRMGETVAALQQAGVNALFGFGASPDEKNSRMVIGLASQGGLGLPDRDYYLKDDEKSKKMRDAYEAYAARLLTLAGADEAAARDDAGRILALETRLAKASYTRVQLRDPQSNYHKMQVRGLVALTPKFGWGPYLRRIGIVESTPVNVQQTVFFKGLQATMADVPLATWKRYLEVRLLDAYAPALPKAFVEAHFDFKGRTLKGTTEMLPRWKRVLRVVDGQIGEALGQEYVKVAFPPSSKQRMLTLVGNLRAALRDDIQKLPWMSPQTKKQALAKLAAMREKIGYPDRWRDYSALSIDRASYARNIIRSSEFEFRRQMKRIGKPPDLGEWQMSPPTVNAYYDPNLNEIVFPAGILQPPFFDPKADDAVNYGAIGAVIGHEMTHGFDDSGAQYDAHGNLRNWWTKQDLANFKARAKCVEDEFSAFEVQPGLKGNGKLVQGEAIADLGGLTIAWMAWERSLKGKPAPPVIGGFSGPQRFFLGFGQSWAENIRPEYARLLTTTDPHPLSMLRVNGTVGNMPAFWKAFGCKSGQSMERGTPCRIW